MDPLQENTSAAFMSVSTSADENLFILPAFTDWDALHRWSSMMMEKDAVTLIMKYEEVEKIMENGFGELLSIRLGLNHSLCLNSFVRRFFK